MIDESIKMPTPQATQDIIASAKNHCGAKSDGVPDEALAGMLSARNIFDKEFPPQIELVPGMIAAGTVLLAAAPKIGKSWMVLGLALASAGGSSAFGGVPVEQRPVLYLALEDGERRIQSRLRSLGVEQPPDQLFFVLQPKSDVLDVIRAFMDKYGDKQPLVILDTLGKVLPSVPAHRGEGAYERDYRLMSALKQVTDEHYGSTLLIVHHTRKMGALDAVETVSGTNGIVGAADAVMTLTRPRASSDGVLFVTSRDAEEGEYKMSFSSNGEWRLTGGSLESARQAAQFSQQSDNLDQRSQSVLSVVQQHPEGVKAIEIANKLGLQRSGVDIILSRLLKSGRISKPRRGVYTPQTEQLSLNMTQVQEV